MKSSNMKHKFLFGLSVGLLSTSVFAEVHQFVMPNCLSESLTLKSNTLAKTKQLSLLAIDSKHMTTLVLQAHKIHCGGFVDVTHKLNQSLKGTLDYKAFLNAQQAKKPAITHTSYTISHEKAVKALVSQVEPNNIWKTLGSLTSFSDRYANSETGVEAAQWIKDNFDSMARDAGRTDVKSYFVQTGPWYDQPSVVTVIGADLKTDAVVIGGHMDTLPYSKPGADDDGSGSSSITEAARVVLNSDEKLTHPVYFIWYAAEEMGLVGSSYVVDDFIDKKIPVKAVIQFDMTGYRYHNSDKMWLLSDNVDKDLSDFVATLIETYVGAPLGWTQCGYGCSDHASWYQEGFKASAPFEAKFGEEDPYIHTGNDTMEYVSVDHMTNFTKLAVAFAGELAS